VEDDEANVSRVNYKRTDSQESLTRRPLARPAEVREVEAVKLRDRREGKVRHVEGWDRHVGKFEVTPGANAAVEFESPVERRKVWKEVLRKYNGEVDVVG